MTILSNYSLNMYGNTGTVFFNQGLGMLNTGSFGCGNIFYDCYGQPNFDAMAGAAAGNALLGVAMQAVSTTIQNKKSEVNYTQEISDINEKIDTKQNEVTKKLTEVTTLNGKISDADEEINKLNTKLSKAKTSFEDAEKNFSKAKEGDENYLELKRTYDKAKEAYEKTIPEEIEAQRKIKTEAEKQKEELNTEIAELQDEIKKLQDKKAELQKASDAKTIQNAKSTSWQRADESCINDWQEASSEKQATKKELKRAIYEYKHAKTDDAKKEAALAVKNMFESNEDGLKDYKCVYEAVKREQNL